MVMAFGYGEVIGILNALNRIVKVINNIGDIVIQKLDSFDKSCINNLLQEFLLKNPVNTITLANFVFISKGQSVGRQALDWHVSPLK